jgi:Ca-activated chloride channel family protein
MRRRWTIFELALFLALLLPLSGCNGTGAGPGDTDEPEVKRVDDWAYDAAPQEEERATAKAVSGAAAPPAAPAKSPAARANDRLGLAAGGAKDVGNFRENIENGYLPLPTDITYEGLFYDYTFDTGEQAPPEGLFSPSWAVAVSKDPISHKTDRYLAVGLNSNLTEADFERKRLNLVVVLDISGSMGSRFDEYYYDRFGHRREAEPGEKSEKSKMRLAAEAIVAMLDHLRPGDRLGIVLFDNQSYLAKPMNDVGQTDMAAIRKHLLEIEDRGGTNMSAGMRSGIDLLAPYADADRAKFENRIVFLTDAQPNRGETSETGLLGMATKAANRGIYTTFVGIGVDFNTELVEAITKMRGANDYSVHSAKQFEKRLGEEFDFMVTPLVFDLELSLEADGYEIAEVYGSPQADEATGELMKVATLFPSKVEEGETRGGVVLLKLRKTGEGGTIRLRASYVDRTGKAGTTTATVEMPAGDDETFANTGVRKAVLLARYADLMKNWLAEERLRASGVTIDEPFVTVDDGIPVPDDGRSKWERTSLPLRADVHYQEMFGVFLDHLRAEEKAVGDESLEREAKILEKLLSLER